MTDFTAMFDTFGVPCKDSGTLFYGEYPFKITITDPVESVKFRNGFSYSSPTHQKALEDHRVARLTFMRKRYRTITADPKDWRWMDNQGAKTFSYFFKNATDALSFCAKNSAHLKSITRPLNQGEVDAHTAFKEPKTKLVVRENLFWNKYRYCIQFKHEDEAREAADAFFDAHIKPYEDEVGRAMYNYDANRRLYLNDARDVFYAKMGVGEYFKTFQKAILKSEISNANEPDARP